MISVEKLYFNWMCGSVDNLESKYNKLLDLLNDIEFSYILPLDENRCLDGLHMRYRYYLNEGLSKKGIQEKIKNKPCSVLEMFVALSKRCDEEILYDYRIGSRQNVWFWTMLNNMHLTKYDDDNFDREAVLHILTNFINRTYDKNGTNGCPFITNDPTVDMRSIEIWYQLNKWIVEFNVS